MINIPVSTGPTSATNMANYLGDERDIKLCQFWKVWPYIYMHLKLCILLVVCLVVMDSARKFGKPDSTYVNILTKSYDFTSKATGYIVSPYYITYRVSRDIITSIPSWVERAVKKLIEITPILIEKLGQFVIKLLTNLAEVTKWIARQVEWIYDKICKVSRWIARTIGKVVKKLARWVLRMVNYIGDWCYTVFNWVYDTVAAFISWVYEKLNSLFSVCLKICKRFLVFTWTQLKKIGRTLSTIIKELGASIYKTFKIVWFYAQKAYYWFRDFCYDYIWVPCKAICVSVGNTLYNIVSNLYSSLKDIGTGITKTLVNIGNSLYGTISNIVANIYESLTSILANLGTTLTTIGNNLSKTMYDVFDNIYETVVSVSGLGEREGSTVSSKVASRKENKEGKETKEDTPALRRSERLRNLHEK